ncbi:hypothetical protein OBBRIDRAFT_806534 [Obba rivulosa]|uniref:Protein kinase domain-containing protein n=1 Tax=Obba rivulosa TaxID=1052685 RepID=A0A8E2AR12_9APHY|nr:hypothetical protein OBBRIDRAFT_806534 [Obba rivulosa]
MNVTSDPTLESYSCLHPLPLNLRAWRQIDSNADGWFLPWDHLRDFFLKSGYKLYYGRSRGHYCEPLDWSPPSADSFDLCGDRQEFQGPRLKMEPNHFDHILHKHALVMAARDNCNRDVVIKVVAKGEDGMKELEILQYINSEPLRSDPRNATVPVLEFLQYQDWWFAVMPRDASECLEFTEQMLSALVFLHDHRIAHLDISNENILLNHRGKLPPTMMYCPEAEFPHVDIWPPHPWRSTFPARFLPIFLCLSAGLSRNLEPRVFYGWFEDVVHCAPGFLQLLQDMTSFNPARRPSAAEALDRFRTVRSLFPKDQLLEVHEYAIWRFPPVLRPQWIMLRDLLECRQWYLAFDYSRLALKNCCAKGHEKGYVLKLYSTLRLTKLYPSYVASTRFHFRRCTALNHIVYGPAYPDVTIV